MVSGGGGVVNCGGLVAVCVGCGLLSGDVCACAVSGGGGMVSGGGLVVVCVGDGMVSGVARLLS